LRLPIRRHQFILIALSASAGGWGGWLLAHSGLAVFVGIVMGIGGGALASLVVGDRKLLADAAANGPDGEEAMQSPSFQIGTVVRLRSGGPAMVVVSVRGESTSCEWFDEGQKRRGEFPTAALECDE